LRKTQYATASTALALLSNQKLIGLLGEGVGHDAGIGGTTCTLDVDGVRVFAKKIRLTDIERRPEHWMSTANLFELPLFYQYGVGSAGFGAWRELATHIMTTNWVLADECANFPLMYHWRVLPRDRQTPTPEELAHVEHMVTYWDNSHAIRGRLEANLRTSADLVVFLEYWPHRLDHWLSAQIAQGDRVNEAISMIAKGIEFTTSFMSAHSLIHFDGHFRNILTDGHQLCFSDFGLALCDRFELSAEELAFFARHRQYDLACSMAHLVKQTLELSPQKSELNDVIRHYEPMATVMKRFWTALRHTSKATVYPNREIRLALTSQSEPAN
jgi:hypothetical protein